MKTLCSCHVVQSVPTPPKSFTRLEDEDGDHESLYTGSDYPHAKATSTTYYLGTVFLLLFILSTHLPLKESLVYGL